MVFYLLKLAGLPYCLKVLFEIIPLPRQPIHASYCQCQSPWVSRATSGIISFEYELSHFRVKLQHLECDSLYGKLWSGGPDLTLGKC